LALCSRRRCFTTGSAKNSLSIHSLLLSVGLDPVAYGPSKIHSPQLSPMAITPNTPQEDQVRYAYHERSISPPSTSTAMCWLDLDKREQFHLRKQRTGGVQKPTLVRNTMNDRISSPKRTKNMSLKVGSRDEEHMNAKSTGPVGVIDEETTEQTKFLTGKWSEEEHEQFLRGLNEFGHQWSLIARYYVKTRERSQIASHAQKYFKKLQGE
jgi:SHAQKYF class myb-like DNA-binding protein